MAITLDELCLKIPSKFSLVMVAAKRARQIKDGAPRLVATTSVNPVTIAMEEIGQGKIVLEGMTARVIDEFAHTLPSPRQRDLDVLLTLPIEDDFKSILTDEPGALESPGHDRLLSLLMGNMDADAADIDAADIDAADDDADDDDAAGEEAEGGTGGDLAAVEAGGDGATSQE